MKSPCAILALLSLLLFAGAIEARNEPGAYRRTATYYQPTPRPIVLKPNPSDQSRGLINLRPIPSGPAYALIRSDPSNGFIPSGKSDTDKRQERGEYSSQQRKSSPITQNEKLKTPKSSAKYLDATPCFTMIFDDGFRHKNSPAKDSRLTPDDIAIIHLLQDLRKAFLSTPVKATPDVETINMDVKTLTKSFYNNFSPTVSYGSPYYDDLKRAFLSSVKATPGVATSIDVTPTKSFYSKFRVTPYASPYYGVVVPKGENPPVQPSPRTILNWN